MKYKKGTFITIPNKQYLKRKPPILQVIFIWLCDHADDNGICYPSRERLADECGCEVRSIDKYMEILVSDGAIKKTKRKKPKSRENASNLYQVMIIEKLIKESDLKSLPSDLYSLSGGESNVPITQSSINSNQLTVASDKSEVEVKNKTKKQLREEAPFDDKKEQQALWDSGWIRKKIVHNYFQKKNIHFENVKQFDSAVGRFLKVAEKLEGYTSRQIEKTMNYFEDKKLSWTLETIAKNISEVVNRV